MCRNIRVLYNFEPPTTPEEIRDAALQFVRKVSGIHKPSHADEVAFTRAIDDVAASTERLLGTLVAGGRVRTREQERAQARARWQRRAAHLQR
ncbi:MAG TPA: DUF2277 domain-containing protein [Polyangia bacterium]|nr:DUF2277 domain-containing protein [Polyangia bacterium]